MIVKRKINIYLNRGFKKKAFYLSINVFSTKVLTGDTIFYVSYWRRDRYFTRPSEPFAGQRQYLHFSVILRPWVLVVSRKSNPQPRAHNGISRFYMFPFQYFRIGTWYSPFLPLMAIIKLPITFYAKKVGQIFQSYFSWAIFSKYGLSRM